MPAPRVGGQLESSLYVADLDRAQDFYTGLFGFELFLRDDRMCGLGVPGGSVLLLFRRGGSTQPSPTEGGGFIPAHDGQGQLHLAFGIPVGELGAWETHLGDRGVVVESRVAWPRGGVSLYFRDPDGNSVEVATPGLWPSY